MTKQENHSPAYSNPSHSDEYIQFASFGRPHGLKGAFFLKTEDRRKTWDGYSILWIESKNSLEEKKVLRHYVSGDALVLELEGLNTRELVEKLYLKKIYVHKSQIQLNKDEEFLVNDLVQFHIIHKEKGLLGKVIGVISYGAQENLEIKMAQTNNIVLYPFVDKYILNINYEKKEIEVEYLEEFFQG